MGRLRALLARLLGDAAEEPGERPTMLVFPGPHGMESRLDYTQLGRVMQARRMLEREAA